jgi:poly-gamma-glutamate capsule biosynthesis protein CapA/YwtB (metallophosphatase superfamily)
VDEVRRETALREVSTVRIAAVGDCLIARSLRDQGDVDFRDLESLLRGADLAFANLEITTPRQPWIPFSEHGGANAAVGPFVLDDLSRMGFRLFSVANNHAVDYTFHGLVDTMDELRQRHLTFAGGGRDLAEARAAAFVDAAGHRVALVAATSTFPTSAQAAARREDMAGRPGVSVLRHHTEYVVTSEQLSNLVQMASSMQLREQPGRASPERETEGAYRFLGHEFRAARDGEPCGVRSRCHEKDLADIVSVVRDARQHADLVLVSLHGHEGQGGAGNDESIADHLVEFAHAAVDAGADIFIGHGPHVLRGVEIYNARPIFYSLGNFVFTPDSVAPYPAELYERLGLASTATPSDVHDKRSGGPGEEPRGFLADSAFWQSVVPVVEWEQGRTARIVFHPVELGQPLPREERGLARLTAYDAGASILERLAALSTPFGTHLEVTRAADGRAVGVVALG